MRRFHPSSRPDALHHKVREGVEGRRFRPPSQRRVELRVAEGLGMAAEAREAVATLMAMAKTGKIAVAGNFMPDRNLSKTLLAQGVAEQVEEADFFRFDRVVIPFHGVPPRQRQAWEQAGSRLCDLSSALVRRAQVALGLLRMEGAQALVIGRHEDSETLAIAGGHPGAAVIEDTTDTARLLFAPAFGAVCQTTLSPRRVGWLVQQLRHRYQDSEVTFLDTTCASMAAREQGLEALLPECDQVVIVGEPGEASCEALAEAALRRGKPSVIVSGVEDLEALDLGDGRRVALSAGGFATDAVVRAVAAALVA